VQDAMVIRDASYTLYDKTGAALKLDLANIGKLLKFEPALKYETTGDGKLTITDPVTICVKNVVWLGKDFRTLGSTASAAKTADSLFKATYEKEAQANR
jgi:hypothetical protein